jgi:predicted AAA+ superfamily ATPase
LNDYGPELLGNYVDSYLREEIQAEALTRNIQNFARFLDVAAHASGQVLNYSQLASDSEIPKETLRRYFDILEDKLLVHRIPGFVAIGGSRKAIQKEKILFFDMGVRNAVLGHHKNVFSDPQLGSLFEQLIINQTIAFAKYHRLDWKFHFYRDDLKREVDLIVDRGSDILAVEIKYGRKVDPKALAGLTAFQAVAKKKVVPILVYRGMEPQRRGDCLILPYQQFFDQLAKKHEELE